MKRERASIGRLESNFAFRVAIYRLIRGVPRGQVVTYGQVAMWLGRPRSARAVGGAMGRCPDDVPWHRVVNAQGGISRRRQVSGMLTQRMRLEQEGVRLRRGRVPLASYRWEPPGRPRRPVSKGREGRERACGWR
ncbi:MAG TPA: MGMT family protein [Patescibacteria group bacterium]|nr:MGMT family protein [Patescibacteria group bacterium]